MKMVEIHKILSNGNISGSFEYFITDIDTNDRIFRLFGLQFGLAMEKENGRIPVYKYDVITEDDDIEGFESPVLYNKGSKVIDDNGKMVTIHRVRNNGNPVLVYA